MDPFKRMPKVIQVCYEKIDYFHLIHTKDNQTSLKSFHAKLKNPDLPAPVSDSSNGVRMMLVQTGDKPWEVKWSRAENPMLVEVMPSSPMYLK